MTTMVLAIGQLHRFTLTEYHQLLECAALGEDQRLELIDGMICDMSPKTREHDQAIDWLGEWLFSCVDLRRFLIRVQNALTLASSEPQPDLAVVPRDVPRPYHPATATLVIEVAVSSQRRDLVEKPPQYAGAGVLEYWVVDLDDRRAVIHREPTGGRYAEVVQMAADGVIRAQALSLPALELSELLAAALR
jgi:Uma2 family endonuclease